MIIYRQLTSHGPNYWFANYYFIAGEPFVLLDYFANLHLDKPVRSEYTVQRLCDDASNGFEGVTSLGCGTCLLVGAGIDSEMDLKAFPRSAFILKNPEWK